ncbi:MAG: glycosyltransferase [Verrucomicrobiota bacterium]|nr:glycosyltransferase [Verrucomicrobiota bacterium]
MASIGVVIPNFNQGASIAETIESILSQTVLPNEIVVIDDASTDDSVEIIRSLSSEVPILRLIRNENNQGVSYCMNLGTKEAQSDFIIYRAADDVFIQNAISNAQKAFQTYPHASIACGETIFFQDELTYGTRETLALADQTTFFLPDKLMECWQSDFNLPSSACITRRNAVLSVGGFKEKARWHADWFCLTTIALRDGLTFIPHPITGFRLSATSYGNSNLLNRKAQRTVLKHLIKEVMDYEQPLRDRFLDSGAFCIFGEPIKCLLDEEGDIFSMKSRMLAKQQSEKNAKGNNNIESGILGVVNRRLIEVKDELTFLKSKSDAKIFVYGAGLQTSFLLEAWQNLSLPPISGIILTQTEGITKRFGYSVFSLNSLSNVDLVLLSSKSFESEMAKTLDHEMPSVKRLSFWIKQFTKI